MGARVYPNEADTCFEGLKTVLLPAKTGLKGGNRGHTSRGTVGAADEPERMMESTTKTPGLGLMTGMRGGATSRAGAGRGSPCRLVSDADGEPVGVLPPDDTLRPCKAPDKPGCGFLHRYCRGIPSSCGLPRDESLSG